MRKTPAPAAPAPVPRVPKVTRPAKLGPASNAHVLFLQRTAGNRAVQLLVVARRKETATGPLSEAQVQKALSFYRLQPARYTPGIIMDIQFEVGTVPTGRMTPLDVQAVAERQRKMNETEKPPLKVDGMAGPRTLPAVFKIGLAKDETLTSYTKKAAEMWKEKGKTEEQIAEDIVKTQLIPRLEALKMPAIKFKIDTNLGARGQFSRSDWELKLDDQQFKPGPRHDLKETTATIYHEGRHAEQHFRVAQMLAGRKRTAEQIHEETDLNLDVAKVAVDNPLKPGTMEAVIAEGWYESFHSPAGRERQRRNNEEIRAAFDEREEARKAHKADPSPANTARLAKAEARFKKATAEHDDIPHEFDAERLKARVEEKF